MELCWLVTLFLRILLAFWYLKPFIVGGNFGLFDFVPLCLVLIVIEPKSCGKGKKKDSFGKLELGIALYFILS